MADITYDIQNIYVATKVPTGTFVKAVISVLGTSIFIGLFCIAAAMQDDKPNVLPFVLPIIYALTLGKLFTWNVMGEELIIISSTHLSYQHNYGLWKTKLSTQSYNSIEKFENDDKMLTIVFFKYDEETKLPKNVFESAIKIGFEDYQKIINWLDDTKIDEMGRKKGFPIFIPN